MKAAKEECRNFLLKINDSETNVMVMNGEAKVQLDGSELETVEQFKYLRSIIWTDASSSKEMTVRLAKGIASDLNNIWADKNIVYHLIAVVRT